MEEAENLSRQAQPPEERAVLGKRGRSANHMLFVIQKHDATRLYHVVELHDINHTLNTALEPYKAEKIR